MVSRKNPAGAPLDQELLDSAILKKGEWKHALERRQ
jgi:hypothetical protein